jgi:hypothetical protein
MLHIDTLQLFLPNCVAGFHPNPLWDRSVLFLLFCQFHFYPEGLVCTLQNKTKMFESWINEERRMVKCAILLRKYKIATKRTIIIKLHINSKSSALHQTQSWIFDTYCVKRTISCSIIVLFLCHNFNIYFSTMLLFWEHRVRKEVDIQSFLPC